MIKVTVIFLQSFVFLSQIAFQIKNTNMKNIAIKNGIMHEASVFIIKTEFPKNALLESARKQSNETIESVTYPIY